jgi:hypothetical protein
MFDSSSRYAQQPTHTYLDEQGRVRRFVSLREIPPPVPRREDDPVHVVGDAERQDCIAWQILGDPTLYWRLCDANGLLHPDEMTATVGRRLLAPLDGREGQR